jgi:dihydroneopterin aldolase
LDRIEIRGIRAYGRHGADPGERDRPQAFTIDVVVDLDLSRARRSDDLNDTLNYARLYHRIVEVVAGTSHALLERLAADLLDAAFEDSRVERAQITVGKPGLLDGATPSVTIAREKP